MTGPDVVPPAPERRTRFFNPTLLAAVAALAVWVVLAFVARVPAGWPHLFLAAGVLLLVRRVVTGPGAW